jgi:hypothetical protein
MARALGEDELIEQWTLVGDEWTLLAGKHGPTRLGFALLLNHLNHGRFLRGRSELDDDVVAYVAAQVRVPRPTSPFYEWDGCFGLPKVPAGRVLPGVQSVLERHPVPESVFAGQWRVV